MATVRNIEVAADTLNGRCTCVRAVRLPLGTARPASSVPLVTLLRHENNEPAVIPHGQ
jgi:hypothetical protein